MVNCVSKNNEIGSNQNSVGNLVGDLYIGTTSAGYPDAGIVVSLEGCLYEDNIKPSEFSHGPEDNLIGGGHIDRWKLIKQEQTKTIIVIIY